MAPPSQRGVPPLVDMPQCTTGAYSRLLGAASHIARFAITKQLQTGIGRLRGQLDKTLDSLKRRDFQMDQTDHGHTNSRAAKLGF